MSGQRFTTFIFLVAVAFAGSSLGAQDVCHPTDRVDTQRWWEFPRYYRNVATGGLIETLAEVCLGYDEVVNNDGITITRVCYDRRVAARNVTGPGMPSLPIKMVVVRKGDFLNFANVFIPYPSEIGDWMPLPATCYPKSQVAAVSYGMLIVQ